MKNVKNDPLFDIVSAFFGSIYPKDHPNKPTEKEIADVVTNPNPKKKKTIFNK